MTVYKVEILKKDVLYIEAENEIVAENSIVEMMEKDENLQIHEVGSAAPITILQAETIGESLEATQDVMDSDNAEAGSDVESAKPSA